MKFAYAVLATLIAATPAFAAPGKICVDPHWSYEAHPLSGRDIVVKQTLGHDRRPLKVSTTCIDLESADVIRLSTDFTCLSMGDQVLASKIDGHRQSCRVTHVEPLDAGAEGHG